MGVMRHSAHKAVCFSLVLIDKPRTRSSGGDVAWVYVCLRGCEPCSAHNLASGIPAPSFMKVSVYKQKALWPQTLERLLVPRGCCQKAPATDHLWPSPLSDIPRLKNRPLSEPALSPLYLFNWAAVPFITLFTGSLLVAL